MKKFNTTSSEWNKFRFKTNTKLRTLMGVVAIVFTLLVLGSLSDSKHTSGASATVGMAALAFMPFAKRQMKTDFALFNNGGGGTETPEEKSQRELIEKINKSISDKFPHLKELDGFKSQLSDLSEKISKSKSEADFKALTDQLEEIGLKVKAMGENPTQKKDIKTQLREFLVSKKDEIAKIHKAGAGVLELELKAVGDIGLGSGTIQGSIPQYPIWGDPKFNLIGNFIDSLITVSSTGMPNFPYTEMIPKDGDFSFLGEGATKPEIDFKWETRYVTPHKVAAWERLSMEVAQDVPRIESLANDLLLKKHNIKKQRSIISGPGTGNDPKGMIEYGRAFVAGSMALSVTTPSIMDVINACIVDIMTTHNYQDEMAYQANTVMLNPIDYFKHIQTPKDSLSRALFNYSPVAFNQAVGTPNNNSGDGTGTYPAAAVSIISTPEIPVGHILVCDASKYNSVNYIPYTVRIGWINDDFINNQFVILAESRFMTYVKKLDEQAFIYDDISTIKTAITKP